MRKSALGIGIILSLGSVGCAGFGVPHNSSLIAQYTANRGVDSLWEAREKAPSEGMELPFYAEQELGRLWDSRREAPTGVAGTGYERSRAGDLWNPPSVSPGWERH
jgi:hypothetical protein